MSISYPQPKPETFWGWCELCISWFFTSVVWGMIPLGVTLFFAIAIGMSPDLGNELRVGGTVLALTLCGTQLIDDLPIPQRQLKKWKWLKNSSIVLICFGAIVAALNVLYGANASLGQLSVDLDLLNNSAKALFALALTVSFLAFLIRVVAASESFEQALDAKKQEMIDSAESNNEVDGMKI